MCDVVHRLQKFRRSRLCSPYPKEVGESRKWRQDERLITGSRSVSRLRSCSCGSVLHQLQELAASAGFPSPATVSEHRELQSHTLPNPLAWIRGRVGRAFITAVGRPAPGGAYAGNRPFTRRVGVNRTAVVSSEINLLTASIDSRAWESWNYRRSEPGFRSPYTLADPARALVLCPNRRCGCEEGKSPNDEAVQHLGPRFELRTIGQFGCLDGHQSD